MSRYIYFYTSVAHLRLCQLSRRVSIFDPQASFTFDRSFWLANFYFWPEFHGFDPRLPDQFLRMGKIRQSLFDDHIFKKKMYIFLFCVYITAMDRVLEYTCKNNGCGFEGNVLHHAPHCTREVQDRPASCQLSTQCRALGCYVVKGPHPSADAIFHNNHRVELRPWLGHYWDPRMWDFLRVPAVRAAVEPDEGYFSA